MFVSDRWVSFCFVSVVYYAAGHVLIGFWFFLVFFGEKQSYAFWFRPEKREGFPLTIVGRVRSPVRVVSIVLVVLRLMTVRRCVAVGSLFVLRLGIVRKVGCIVIHQWYYTDDLSRLVLLTV